MSPIVSLRRSGNSKIPDGLGFSQHMKTRLKNRGNNVSISIISAVYNSAYQYLMQFLELLNNITILKRNLNIMF